MRSNPKTFICEDCNQPSGSADPEQVFCSDCIEAMARGESCCKEHELKDSDYTVDLGEIIGGE